jgi:uncharacterized membrane protein YcgQ (UPF0703/DUF1980 family)
MRPSSSAQSKHQLRALPPASNLAMIAFIIHTPSHTRVVFCDCKNNVRDAISLIFSINIFLALSAFVVNVSLYSSSIFSARGTFFSTRLFSALNRAGCVLTNHTEIFASTPDECVLHFSIEIPQSKFRTSHDCWKRLNLLRRRLKHLTETPR